MVEHDFAKFDGESRSHADQRLATGTCAVTQAFFYAADLWVDKPPLVSVKALEYASQRWGDQSSKIWTLKRKQVRQLDGCKISESGLLYEHVTTGGMFRTFIQTMLKDRDGTLDAYSVARWLHTNFQTAWITREEDQSLTNNGFKSQRGIYLTDAHSVYERCGVAIAVRPEDSPTVVCVGDSEILNEMLAEDVNQGQAAQATRDEEGAYAQFFTLVATALQRRNSLGRVHHTRNSDYYTTLKGFTTPGVNFVLLLDAPKGAKARTPVLSIGAVTKTPGQEPSSEAWTDVRDIFLGPEWSIQYGRHDRVKYALCRCKRALAEAYEVTDATAQRAAAENAGAELHALRALLHG